MLIINADDWGGWPGATDAALACFQEGRITSASAMVFMEDSRRAAELGLRVGLDIGLHVNFTQSFTGGTAPVELVRAHGRLKCFLKASRYAQLLYHPLLRGDFARVYRAQADEFRRLYGKEPSHVDGHQHMHLCANMVLDGVIESGRAVRRNFSFSPGEKGPVNRWYRHWVDGRQAWRYRMTDHFFSLAQSLQAGSVERVADLARRGHVELMTHPEQGEERGWLLSDRFKRCFADVQTAPYSALY